MHDNYIHLTYSTYESLLNDLQKGKKIRNLMQNQIRNERLKGGEKMNKHMKY